MIDKEIKEQLDRIEQYSLIAAKNVLNINEAAIILGMTVRGVRENVRNRIIPCYKPNVNRLYFKKSELEEWMTQNRRKSMAELKSSSGSGPVNFTGLWMWRAWKAVSVAKCP